MTRKKRAECALKCDAICVVDTELKVTPAVETIVMGTGKDTVMVGKTRKKIWMMNIAVLVTAVVVICKIRVGVSVLLTLAI